MGDVGEVAEPQRATALLRRRAGGDRGEEPDRDGGDDREHRQPGEPAGDLHVWDLRLWGWTKNLRKSDRQGKVLSEASQMRISAKADYAVRAAAELAAASPGGRPVKGEQLAAAQGIPPQFLENILADLRHAGLRRHRRGADGGYSLTRVPSEISVAEVLRGSRGTAGRGPGLPPRGPALPGRRRPPPRGVGGPARQPARRARAGDARGPGLRASCPRAWSPSRPPPTPGNRTDSTA